MAQSAAISRAVDVAQSVREARTASPVMRREMQLADAGRVRSEFSLVSSRCRQSRPRKGWHASEHPACRFARSVVLRASAGRRSRTSHVVTPKPSSRTPSSRSCRQPTRTAPLAQPPRSCSYRATTDPITEGARVTEYETILVEARGRGAGGSP